MNGEIGIFHVSIIIKQYATKSKWFLFTFFFLRSVDPPKNSWDFHRHFLGEKKMEKKINVQST